MNSKQRRREKRWRLEVLRELRSYLNRTLSKTLREPIDDPNLSDGEVIDRITDLCNRLDEL